MSILTEHQKKALNYKNHISLTANAGSGKTFVLAKRYLQIALNENISLRNIAAITFTEKAAGELYKKIANEIEDSLALSNNPAEIKKLESIRRQLVSANISTIHSFCIDILREFPIEAKLDANFIPIDERLSDEFIELSVEEAVKDFIRDNEKKNNLEYLIRVFASKNILANQITSLIKQRKNVLAVKEKIYCQSEDKISEFFYNSFVDYSRKIFGAGLDPAINIIDEINQLVLSVNDKNILANEISADLAKYYSQKIFHSKLNVVISIKDKITTASGSVKNRGYLSARLRENIEDKIITLERFIEDLSFIHEIENHNELETELAKFGKKVIDFFDVVSEIYSRKKRENGYLDYEDILLFTQKIISNNFVRNSLSEKYKFLLIDEYQDTNELQYSIFLPILEELRKGNLFVVGDEKQSIYIFRDAELEVFNRTKNNIKEIDGNTSLLTLPDSFRMAPELCLFTNVLFRKLFSNPNELYNDVNHSDLVCAVDEEVKGKVEIIISKSDDALNETESGEFYSEAELAARKILQLTSSDKNEQKINWHDIAILCRKRKSFKSLEKVFIKYNIPFLILGGRDFYQRQIIYDVYNYFSFLLDENDDTALIGFLRSPFCCLSDSEIFQVSLLPGKNYYNKLINYCEFDDVTKSKVIIIFNIKNNYANSDFVFLLRKILNESNYLAVIAAQPDGDQELANIRKLIQLTINFYSQGFKTLFDYVNFLKESIDNSYEEAQAAVADDSNAVMLMTLHQAKGLEFPVVFLFDSGDNTTTDTTKSKSITVNKNFGLLTKLPLNENYFDEYPPAPIIGISDLINSKKNLAEVKRLFYVGVTRAKYYLIITATAGKGMKFKKESFIDLLMKGLNINLNENNFIIESGLTFLKPINENYFNITKSAKLNIPIISEIEETAIKKEPAQINYRQRKLLTEIITEVPKGEVISATKYAAYSQCPLKYHLWHELGVNLLVDKISPTSKYKSKKNVFSANYLEVENEDEGDETDMLSLTGIARLKGVIIHRILEKEFSTDDYESIWNDVAGNFIDQTKYGKEEISSIKSQIKALLNAYAVSEIFKKIKRFSDYKNEFEVYVKEGEYFLHGIIDKIIFDGNEIIIVDYKTDELSVNDIKEKSKAYINQLKFYSYIVSQLFADVAKIKLILLFLEHPAQCINIDLSSKDLNEIKNKINLMIQNISLQVYSKNLDHCRQCKFSIYSGRCIKD